MAATYEPIATYTAPSAQATVSFTSISGSYTDLVVVFNGAETVDNGIKIVINNDTGTNYSNTRLVGNGSTGTSARRSSTASVYLDEGIVFSTTVGNNNCILHFMNYSNTTTYKTWLQRANNAASGTVAVVGLWRSTSAINRLDFVMTNPQISTGSTFTLYGIKAA